VHGDAGRPRMRTSVTHRARRGPVARVTPVTSGNRVLATAAAGITALSLVFRAAAGPLMTSKSRTVGLGGNGQWRPLHVPAIGASEVTYYLFQPWRQLVGVTSWQAVGIVRGHSEWARARRKAEFLIKTEFCIRPAPVGGTGQ
jgi:hypothetical protein